MKKLFALLVLAAVGTTAFAQSKTIQDFHNKYKEDRDATSVTINGSLFELFGNIASYSEEDEDAQAISRMAKGIKSMEILSIPMFKTGFDGAAIDRMRDELKKENYSELMTMKDGTERVWVLTQGSNKEIKNMLVLIREESNFAIMNINGTLTSEDLGYLVKHRKNWN